jgi:hypothetical protein
MIDNVEQGSPRLIERQRQSMGVKRASLRSSFSGQDRFLQGGTADCKNLTRYSPPPTVGRAYQQPRNAAGGINNDVLGTRNAFDLPMLNLRILRQRAASEDKNQYNG